MSYLPIAECLNTHTIQYYIGWKAIRINDLRAAIAAWPLR